MKRIFEKLGLHKMDEMEQHILFKAQRNAYLFLVIALWSGPSMRAPRSISITAV